VKVGIRGSWVALRHLGPKLDLGHSPQPFAFTFLRLRSRYTQATHNSIIQHLFVAPDIWLGYNPFLLPELHILLIPVNKIEHMAQHLLKAVGLCKPTMFSISRVFSSLHPANVDLSDSVKRKTENDKHAEYFRLKRRTDPEWALRRQASEQRATTKLQAKWTEERYQQCLQYNREHRLKKLAEGPEYRFKEWFNSVVRKYGWMRERLPWKTHTPVLYEEKVQHTCNTCLIPKFGGAFKLWWASHDGQHYLCNACYHKGSDMMPEGYEDVSTTAELRKRRDELGH
jgi:hypothetical protein